MVWCSATGVGPRRKRVELEGEPSSERTKVGQVAIAASEKAGVDRAGDGRRGRDRGDHVEPGHIGDVTLVERPPELRHHDQSVEPVRGRHERPESEVARSSQHTDTAFTRLAAWRVLGRVEGAAVDDHHHSVRRRLVGEHQVFHHLAWPAGMRAEPEECAHVRSVATDEFGVDHGGGVHGQDGCDGAGARAATEADQADRVDGAVLGAALCWRGAVGGAVLGAVAFEVEPHWDATTRWFWRARETSPSALALPDVVARSSLSHRTAPSSSGWRSSSPTGKRRMSLSGSGANVVRMP